MYSVYTVQPETLLHLSPLCVLLGIAYEETLTLSPHVADEYVSIALDPISGFQAL